jgi:hypothetical protein
MNNSFNNLKSTLTADDIESIISIVGYRCRAKTLTRLRSRLTYGPSRIPSYGILERLTKDENGNWEYCAGQSYPDEIRTVRECILES